MVEFDPADWPRFIELPGFTRAWTSLGLSDSDLSALQAAILDGPNRRPVISGTGGLRKIRFARPGEARGRSGSYRACYACFLDRALNDWFAHTRGQCEYTPLYPPFVRGEH